MFYIASLKNIVKNLFSIIFSKLYLYCNVFCHIECLLSKLRQGKVRIIDSFCIVLLLTVSFSSCKSHKSATLNEREMIEDVVSVKKKKDKGKKKISNVRNSLIKEAHTWIGTPYKYGHKEKGSGSDCSGMIMVIYEDVAEIKIPRNSAKQAEFCEKIKQKEILPGDLVFFATGKDKNKVSHVGIMIDEEAFIHASSSKGVTISKMTTPYYQRAFLMFGRVPQLGK